ncbi:MAG: hypothetical protein NTV51_18200, partial [Verrucomicrobia bacterium]|nr:hypothetical protein [Verrucomicrobiota bacterium]
ESCQNALIVKTDGKQQVYFFAANAVNEKFGEVCTDTKKVKATGVVSEKDGKKIFTASKIEPVKS